LAEFDFGGPIVWTPDAASASATHLGRFIAAHRLSGFAELLDRSARDPAWFTDAILRYLDVRFTTPYSEVLDLSAGPAWPRWCVGGRLNIVTSCLDKISSG
jgi:acetyl-CoA synthetase